MKYAHYLIDKAAEKCGSFYRLAQVTGWDESTISKVRRGKMKLPMKHVYHLCQLANISAEEALRELSMEQAANAEQRHRLGNLKVAGGVAMLLTSYNSDFLYDIAIKANDVASFAFLYIVSTTTRQWLHHQRAQWAMNRKAPTINRHNQIAMSACMVQ
jgi:transcriptional regulator with XRE-family HTH domain